MGGLDGGGGFTVMMGRVHVCVCVCARARACASLCVCVCALKASIHHCVSSAPQLCLHRLQVGEGRAGLFFFFFFILTCDPSPPGAPLPRPLTAPSSRRLGRRWGVGEGRNTQRRATQMKIFYFFQELLLFLFKDDCVHEWPWQRPREASAAHCTAGGGGTR